MEFGPADRFDVIELKGFDKHELEREGQSTVHCTVVHVYLLLVYVYMYTVQCVCI